MQTFVEKFTNLRFEPSGMTDDPHIRISAFRIELWITSFRRLALDFLPFETCSAIGLYSASERTRELETSEYTEDPLIETDEFETINEPVALFTKVHPSHPDLHVEGVNKLGWQVIGTQGHIRLHLFNDQRRESSQALPDKPLRC